MSLRLHGESSLRRERHGRVFRLHVVESSDLYVSYRLRPLKLIYNLLLTVSLDRLALDTKISYLPVRYLINVFATSGVGVVLVRARSANSNRRLSHHI
jgi:hypothetical protein